MPRSSLGRGLFFFLVGLAILAIGGAALLWSRQGPQVTTLQGLAPVSIGGPFELVDQNGRTRRDADFRGRYLLVSFGYTYCPDVCPTTLTKMTRALELLAQEAPEVADRVVPLFITIDPARDTGPALKAYAEHFHPRLLALTGSEAQVAAAAKAYRVFYARAESAQASDYLMDHSAFVYFMDPEGAYVTHFAHSATPEEMAQTLRRHAQS